MKLLKNLNRTLPLGALIVTPFAFAQTTLLVNTDFSASPDPYESWIAGSNQIVGGNWVAFVAAPDAYAFDERIGSAGSASTFTSWDDGASDQLENYLFQEFQAGPTNSIFSDGDVIRFTGSASAVVEGADTSDLLVRAFIKTLGFNELGWENQVQDNFTVYHDITGSLDDFDITVTFPDIVTADPFQVVQLGFEIRNSFDPDTQLMDAGTITFENIAGYIDDGSGGGDMWNGLPVDANGWVEAPSLGFLNVTNDPWIFSFALDSFFYGAGFDLSAAGNWIYLQ